MKGAAARQTGQPHLGGAEQQGIDLVEVVIVPLEGVVERRAVVRRGRCRQALDQRRELIVFGVDPLPGDRMDRR